VRLRRVRLTEGDRFSTAVWDGGGERWLPLGPALEALGERDLLRGCDDDVLALLADERLRDAAADVVERSREHDFAGSLELEPALLPFEPRALRAFSLYERHHVQAARGLVRRYAPAPARAAVAAYERSGLTFPALKPKKLFFEKPAFYMGNHLTFVPDGADVRWPPYARDLDYELELAFVLARPVRDVSPEEAEAAIGGFFVINDFSARDVQWRELRETSFGPVVKTKTFANGMGADVVSADEVLSRIDHLTATVHVNREVWGKSNTGGAAHSPGAMVAYASEGEQLQRGEVFAMGTLPGCCGLEIDRWINHGDEVALEIEGVGTLRNRVVAGA
jgi:2-keto-4-pentenoate hydratase/2-oxohepta-3-ene-1,7-dioic acid hydratase in catechol pathway